jgi:hypothetical protein
MQKMITSKSVPLLLVATVSSLIGYSIGRPPQLPALTLEHVKITQIHRAALYVRDLSGQVTKRVPHRDDHALRCGGD